MNKFIYNIYKSIIIYLGERCTDYLIHLPEQERLKFLDEEEQIDLKCKQYKMSKCKHYIVLGCQICGKIFMTQNEINKIADGEKNEKKKKN